MPSMCSGLWHDENRLYRNISVNGSRLDDMNNNEIFKINKKTLEYSYHCMKNSGIFKMKDFDEWIVTA